LEDKNGKTTKIPYNPATGQRAQTNNPATFTDFATALRAVKQYSGLGFLIPAGLFVIDCDHCRAPDGTLTQPAADIAAMFDGCYMEWSPTDGLHIIGQADGLAFNKAMYWMNNRQLGVEVYIGGATNRFMTLTGNVYRAGDIAEKSAKLRAFLEKHMRRDNAAGPARAAGESTLSDEAVIARAGRARNAATFQRLWSGDISGYSSQSEADLALCGILAFWCGRDTGQMDRLFRQSGLYREKWDRPQTGSTYGWITLEKAAADTQNVYKPSQKKSRTAAPGKQFAGRGGVSLWDLQPENNPRYPWADLGSGRIFADYFKSIARFVKERKTWYVYTGKVWEADTAVVEIMKLGKLLADDIMNYAMALPDERVRTAYIEYAKRWQKLAFRVNAIKEAESEYPIQMKEFDEKTFAFNCRNGTLHLDTMEFKEHDSADFLTKMADVRYDPKARCERWEQFISEIIPNDPETADFLQRALGYSLTGETQHECMFILWGRKTRNGKGTLCESVLKIMGDYGRSVNAETLAHKHNQMGNMPSEDIARLAGVRFANISEPSKGLVLNAAQVKSLTGNDSILARFLFENSFEFYPRFKIYINTNYRPNIQDMTLFKSNRIYIISFERHFEGEAQDTTLKEAFAKPANQSGILNWLVAGYKILKERGLVPSPAVLAATDSYRYDSDKIAQFIEDCLTPDPNGEARTSAVYKEYQSWCKRNGVRFEGATNFKQALSATAQIVRKRPRGGGGLTTLLVGFSLPDSVEWEQQMLDL
jgi:putative DNA primase/helicase